MPANTIEEQVDVLRKVYSNPTPYRNIFIYSSCYLLINLISLFLECPNGHVYIVENVRDSSWIEQHI